jgi:hypothetical protein
VDHLVNEWRAQQAATLEGWDMSPARFRLRFQPPPWKYEDQARRLVGASSRLLDLGTGGGEVLYCLGLLPGFSVASDISPDRAQVARRRLSRHGVNVVVANSMATLPLRAGAFDLVLCRNSAFVADAVFHVLDEGGVFYSQQLAENNMRELLDEIGLEGGNEDWKTPEGAVRQLEAAGFSSVEMARAETDVEFSDVGIMLWFLEAVLPGRIDVARCFGALLRLHERRQAGGRLVYVRRVYVLHAVR